MLRNNQPYDQDVETVTDAFPGAEVVPGVPDAGTIQAAEAPSASLVKMRGDFRQPFLAMPWVDQGEAAARLAIQIAMGSAADAGKEIEARSVRNLKLVNKVHTITEIALSESTYGDSSAGPDFYAVVSAVFPDGEIFTYSIGGWIPLAQLAAKFTGQGADGFPWRCQIIATPSRQGNPAYRYVDA